MLSYLNGINKNKMRNNAQINGWFDDLKNNISNTVTNTVSTITNAGQNVINNAQNFLSNIPKLNLSNIDLQNLGQKIKKVTAAPGRAGFYAAVRTNFLKLANRLAAVGNKDQNYLKERWEKGYGGDYNKLKEMINKGIKGVPALNGNSKLGTIDPTTLTLIQVALPVVLGMISVIKAKRGAEDAADGSLDQSELDKLARGFLGIPDKDLDNPPPIPPEFNDSAMPNRTLLIGGGVIVAGGLIYFLTRKK